MRVRSLVGIVPLLAVEILTSDPSRPLPEFLKRTQWFLRHKRELAKHVSLMVGQSSSDRANINRALLAVPSQERLLRVLAYVLDENEFLSPFGVRSLSKAHEKAPLVVNIKGEEYRVDYVPGESTTSAFGGNSNWRGPIWLPLNYLLIEALERYNDFYGDTLTVECPTGSGNTMNLGEVARELRRRLGTIFLPDEEGNRPCHGGEPRLAGTSVDADFVLFHEYFHGESGKGLGASHQTGWTALIAPVLTFPRLSTPLD